MKRLLLALAIALAVPVFGFGQSITINRVDSLTVSFEDQIEYLFSELDEQLIATGIHVERAFPAAPYQFFNGAELNDDNIADYGTWQTLLFVVFRRRTAKYQ